jgi:hypothetical protein
VLAIATAVLLACGDDEDPQASFCDAASDTESFEAIFADFDPADVPSAIEAFSEARDREIELRRDAPDAVRADIDLLVQFLDDLVEGLEDIDPESTSRPAVYDEISTQFDQVEAASARIETYVTANCPPPEDG